MGLVSAPFQRHALRQAAAALGGEAALRQFLNVPLEDLASWLRDRKAQVPDEVIRKVVNLLADIEAGLLPKPRSDALDHTSRPR